MPHKDTGIHLAITVKQLITGVISIASTIILLLWLVMNAYVSDSEHKPFEDTLANVNNYATQDKLDTMGTVLSLQDIKKTQSDNYAKLTNAIEQAQEDQLNLRRDILTFGKISKLTSKEKIELTKLEEFMIRKGLLDSSSKTKID